jgi:hypothetical protein
MRLETPAEARMSSLPNVVIELIFCVKAGEFPSRAVSSAVKALAF